MSMQKKRKTMLLLLGLVFVLAAAWALWHWLEYGRYEQDTDDAYVAGNLVEVMPQLSGNVQAVYADETQRVDVGQPLVQLDGADAALALDKAEATLAQTVRNVRQMMQDARAAEALVQQRQAECDKARSDLQRRASVLDVRAVAREDVQHARDALTAATAALVAAKYQRDASQAAVAGTVLERHPAVLRAEAQVREAWLAQQRLTIRAPVSGYVASRPVQVGERVAPSTVLMVVVPLHQVWLNANFKENQLKRVRIGQPVHIVTDLYGSDVVFHGTVAGLSAGTGTVFSLLPAQNATGNWIKVVQRLPVRIEINQTELGRYPLRIGLSATASIDVHDASGRMLATGQPVAPLYQTPVLAEDLSGADRLIARIVKLNGHP